MTSAQEVRRDGLLDGVMGLFILTGILYAFHQITGAASAIENNMVSMRSTAIEERFGVAVLSDMELEGQPTDTGWSWDVVLEVDGDARACTYFVNRPSGIMGETSSVECDMPIGRVALPVDSPSDVP